jgi:predicted metalloprotease with PDZ domain
LPEGGFEAVASEATGLDLSAFFHQVLRTTVDPPIGILLARFGIRLHFRSSESPSDAGGTRGRREDRPRPWIGAKVRADAGRVRITYVQDAGPAQLAGLSAGDEVVAIDGRRVTPDNYEARLDRLAPGRPAEILVFRDDTLLAMTVAPAPAPRDTCYLVIDPDADPQAVARRERWLATVAGA